MKKNIAVLIGITLLCSVAHADDWSTLNIVATTYSTTTYVQLLVSDPSGRQTGFLASSGTRVQTIPGSSYFTESVDNDETGEAGNQVARFGVGPVSSGTYIVELNGLANTTYVLSLDASDISGGALNVSPASFTGYLQPSTTKQFTLSVDPTPGTKLVLTPVLTFASIKGDLHAAYLLGQIGNKHFVNELDDVLAQGEKALARMNRDHDKHNDAGDNDGKREAVAKLREFVKRIESAAKVKPGDVGRGRDRDDDDRHFATAMAAQSLTADADALIVQLGGKISRGRDDHGEGRH